MKEYAVFHLDGRREPYSGKYCKNAEEAQRYFAWLCFDWFNDKDRPDPALGWKNYGTHRIARYKKWLLLIDCMRDVEDIIYLLRPDADWDNECLVCEYEEITAYEPEWEVGSEREAVDYIDNCEENKASKKGGGSALRHGASREDVAMAMEAVKGDANAAD